MIVIDEQLLGLGVESQVATWYRGAVLFVIALRPDTIIKDDAIPQLLRRERQPAFVTINVRHFWRRDLTDPRFCVVCFSVQDKDAYAISPLLQRLFHHPDFKSKRQRVGHIFRINLDGRARFYKHDSYLRHDFLLQDIY